MYSKMNFISESNFISILIYMSFKFSRLVPKVKIIILALEVDEVFLRICCYIDNDAKYMYK